MKRPRLHAIIVMAIASSMTAIVCADVIELKDGRKFNGKLTDQGANVLILTDDGATVQATSADILKVTQSSPASTDDAAAAEWKRILTQCSLAADLQSVMAMHEKFLKRYATSTLAPQATESLEKYKKLAADGGLKVRNTWLGKVELDALRDQWEADARAARGFYEVGHLKDATDAVKVALAKDDLNQVALTVAGLSTYRLNMTGVSRTYFLSLAASVFPSVIAENNLGVLYFSDKQQTAALSHYVKALQIMPGNRLLLDNIAEALHAYSDDKSVSNYKALTRQYEQASAKMEADMNKQSMRRWGSTWVKQAEYDRLVRMRANIQAVMAKLDLQYRTTRATAANLDTQIAQAQSDVELYEGQLNNIDARTLELQAQINHANFDLNAMGAQRMLALQNLTATQSKLSSLQTQRGKLVGTIEGYRAQAEDLKKQLAKAQPLFTGTQRIMDLDEDKNPPPPVPVDIPDDKPAEQEVKPAQ